MRKNSRHELGKSRVAQIRTADICNGAIIGIVTLWTVWAATSALIRLIR